MVLILKTAPRHNRFSTYVDKKLALAHALNEGQCGGDYSDACVVISTLLSGIAADLWPGEGIDRKRFVEVWVCYADPKLFPLRVSVPLLVRGLRNRKQFKGAQEVQLFRPNCFGAGYETRVLTGDDDADELDVLQACPSLKADFVRNRTYPVVFYEHIRCDLVHENHLGTRAAGVPMTVRPAAVSYVNVLDPRAPGHSQRRIHFHLPFLEDVARSVATNAEADLHKAPLPKPTPNGWWAPKHTK
jgi:hypothetical protein